MGYRSPSVLALSLSATLLAACVTPQPPAQEAAALDQPVLTAAAPASAQQVSAGADGGRAAPEPAVQPVVYHDPKELQELEAVEVEDLLGPPNYVRHDDGAIIWQYNARKCVMDLFWYRSQAGLSLVYLEARGASETRSLALDACLQQLLRNQAVHTAS